MRRTRRLMLALLAATSASVAVIVPARAGGVEVQIAPTEGPTGTPVTLTVTTSDACTSLAWAFTLADPETGTALRAWGTGAQAQLPQAPAEIPVVPQAGLPLFLAVGCFDAEHKVASVACTSMTLLPAGAAPTGSETASLVAHTTLMDTEHEPTACERQNGVPVMLMAAPLQSLIGRVDSTWRALLLPVAATTTSSTTTTLPPPVTTPATVVPTPTTPTTPGT